MDLEKTEMQIEIEALRKEIKRLNNKIDSYKKVIIQNDLADELEKEVIMSTEEQICMDGIKHLAHLFEKGTFDRNDVQNFDILHKNLRQIQGHSADNKKRKKSDISEALKIVEGYKK